jgi:hypothetical protein
MKDFSNKLSLDVTVSKEVVWLSIIGAATFGFCYKSNRDNRLKKDIEEMKLNKELRERWINMPPEAREKYPM